MVYGAIVSNRCSRSQGQPLPGVRSAAISSSKRAMSREGVMSRSRGFASRPPSFRPPNPRAAARSSDSHKRYYGTFTYSWAFAVVFACIRARSRSSQGFSRHADLHAVIGRLDVVRKLAAQDLVVDVGMQVGQGGALRPDAVDPDQRILDGKMTGMRRIAQRIENPDFEVA